MKIKDIKIKDIKIYDNFKEKTPDIRKMERRWQYYRRTGELYAPILVNKEGYLVDGYTSYLVAKTEGIKKVKVIVR